MAGKIFVNYRRDDSAPHALSIAQYLEREFGRANVFLDIDRMRAGEKFPKVLEERLAVSKVMLVVIGPQWLTLKGQDGTRRLDDPEDWVRLEIARALARGIPVIPVLVGGAGLPKKSELPDDLKALVDHQVATVTTNGFRAEMACLERDINTLLGPRRRWPWAAGVAGVLAAGTGFAMYAGLIPMMGLGSLLYPGATTTASDDYCSPGAYDGYQSLRADLDGDGTEELVFAGAQMAFTHAAAKTPSGYDCAKRASSRIGDTPTIYEGFKASLADKTGDDVPDLVMTKGAEAWVHAGRRDGTFAEGSAGRVSASGSDPAVGVAAPVPPPLASPGAHDPADKGNKKLTIAEARRKIEEAKAKRDVLLGQLDGADAAKGAAEDVSRAEAERQAEEKPKADGAATAKSIADQEGADAAERQRLAMLAEKEDGKRDEAARKAEDTTPGRLFRDCPVCPEMVVVPAGEFLMGSPESEEGRGDDEGPQRRVTIAEPFAVGKFEVTFAEWDACVVAGGCKHKAETTWGRGRQPVVRVSWDDAKQYVAWLSKKTDKPYRLLTEAEWEYAARAGTTTAYFWGDTFDGSRANNGTGTVEVGQYRANAWSLFDMHGNVLEWVEDCYKDSYSSAPTDGTASTSGECSRRVVRGGSWNDFPDFLRSANRIRLTTDIRYSYVGFRVGRTLTP